MTQISIGGVDAAVSRTPSGKIRVRLAFTVAQLEAMLVAAREDEDGAPETVKRSVTQCNAPESEERREERDDGGDARARSHPPPDGKSVFVIEGTDAWERWLDHEYRTKGVRSMPIVQGTVNGKTRHGWWKPTLFPPEIEQQSAG